MFAQNVGYTGMMIRGGKRRRKSEETNDDMSAGAEESDRLKADLCSACEAELHAVTLRFAST